MDFLKKTKTVDGIVAAFSKTIDDLETVKRESAELATQKRIEAAQLEFDANNAEHEAQRAGTISTNLRALLGNA